MIKYILIFSTAIVLLLTAVLLHFTSDTDNPIIGSWQSTDVVYGQPKLLVFTEFGMLKDGRHVPANFVIERDKVTVTSNMTSTEYFMVNENMMKQRVPRQTWRFFLRDDSVDGVKEMPNKMTAPVLIN